MLLEQRESCPGLQGLWRERAGRRCGAVPAACGDMCANWKVSGILKTSLSVDVSSFSRAWVIYFAESIFSSILDGPVLEVP